MSAVESETTTTHPRRCTVAVALEVLKGADRRDLESLLTDERVPHAAISRGLATEGVRAKYPDMPRVKRDTVGRHRARGCACPA